MFGDRRQVGFFAVVFVVVLSLGVAGPAATSVSAQAVGEGDGGGLWSGSGNNSNTSGGLGNWTPPKQGNYSGGVITQPNGSGGDSGEISQPGPPNTTAGNETGNFTGNGTGNFSQPGQGGGGLLGDFGLNPLAFFGNALKGFGQMAIQEAAGLLTGIQNIISGMPAPGTISSPSSWINPQDGLWPGVHNVTMITIPLGFTAVGIAAGWAFRFADPFSRREMFKTVGLSAVMILMTWFVVPLALHIGDAVGKGLAPSGAEFLATPGNAAKVGLGFLLLVLLAFGYFTIVAIGLFVLVAQDFLVYLCVAIWPLAWGLRPYGGYLRSLGDGFIYALGTLIAINAIQALILRLLFEFPLGNGLSSALMAVLMTMGGLAFALIYFPKAMLEQSLRAAGVGAGVSAGRREVKQRGQRVQQKINQVRESGSEQFRERYRSDSEPDSGSDYRTSVGSVGGGNSASGNSGGTPTTDGGIDAREHDRQQRLADYSSSSTRRQPND